MSDSVTISDNRTGEQHELQILYGTYPEYGAAIPAATLRGIKRSEGDFGLMTYDPGYTNTASCKSSITFIDGERGILRYRGYPIEELAGNRSYLEIAYLLLEGDLPDSDQLKNWTWEVTHHTIIHEKIKRFMDGFRYDAHPMGMLVSTVAALSTFYPESRRILEPGWEDFPSRAADAVAVRLGWG